LTDQRVGASLSCYRDAPLDRDHRYQGMAMLDPSAVLALQNLVARFANSFDLKDWDGLKECLASSIDTDYSDLRGTPPETMSSEQFVRLRKAALQDLQTHHLAGNVEVALSGTVGRLKVSMVIYRRDLSDQTFDTHCLYSFGVAQTDDVWRISSIKQKVFMNDGQKAIHKGIANR
jgi:hypothetical protein